eukprot:gene3642-13721_t
MSSSTSTAAAVNDAKNATIIDQQRILVDLMNKVSAIKLAAHAEAAKNAAWRLICPTPLSFRSLGSSLRTTMNPSLLTASNLKKIKDKMASKKLIDKMKSTPSTSIIARSQAHETSSYVSGCASVSTPLVV